MPYIPDEINPILRLQSRATIVALGNIASINTGAHLLTARTNIGSAVELRWAEDRRQRTVQRFDLPTHS